MPVVRVRVVFAALPAQTEADIMIPRMVAMPVYSKVLFINSSLLLMSFIVVDDEQPEVHKVCPETMFVNFTAGRHALLTNHIPAHCRDIPVH
jgi:hypothetical protein